MMPPRRRFRESSGGSPGLDYGFVLCTDYIDLFGEAAHDAEPVDEEEFRWAFVVQAFEYEPGIG